MLYVTRNRYKESVPSSDLAKYNQIIDTAIIPALEKVTGVRSAQVYNSIAGELTFVLDIQDLAAIDRVLIDQGCREALSKIYDAIVRTGGEILYDRPQWQTLYAKS